MLKKETEGKFTEQQLRTANQLVLVDKKNDKGLSHQRPLNPILKQSANSLQVDQLEAIEDDDNQHDDQSDAQTTDEDDVNPDAI